jgi:hypothetical protein
MGRALRIAALSQAWLLLGHPLQGGDALRMKVFPAVQRAPAVLTIRISVEKADQNRWLHVTAESPTFYRSSEIQIDGERAAALNVFQFRDMPTGLYQVTSVLTGVDGRRATATALARVEPAVGSAR